MAPSRPDTPSGGSAPPGGKPADVGRSGQPGAGSAKASDLLAEGLRERILAGEFAEDTPLPPERELVVQFKVGRTTVREALRILQAQGLVAIKTGRAGGAFIRRPSEESVANTVDLLIRGREIRMDSLLETREAVEPHCALLAAKYRTEQDLQALDGANAAIAADGPLSNFLRANVDWHVAVATASHNELLTGFMSALSRAIYAGTDNQTFVDLQVRTATAKAHSRITEAIRDRDPDAALRRMSRHVHAFVEAIMEVEERTAIEVD